MDQKSVENTPNRKPPDKEEETDWGPYLTYKYSLDEKTGSKKFESMSLSNGDMASKDNGEKFRRVLKKTTGTENPDYALKIIRRMSHGMHHEDIEDRLNQMSIALSTMKPKDETEAILLGQFITLQESGLRCLRLANSQDGFYHVERFFLLATKLFNTANQTMQALLKYRSGGQQTVQVVHVHNEGGRAIVAQKIDQGGGDGNKF